MSTLAKRLIWARQRAGLSQKELAKAIGVSQSAIGNLESGLRQTSRKITAIASELEVSAAWLAENKGDPLKNISTEIDNVKITPAIKRLINTISEYSDKEIDEINSAIKILLKHKGEGSASKAQIPTMKFTLSEEDNELERSNFSIKKTR